MVNRLMTTLKSVSEARTAQLKLINDAARSGATESAASNGGVGGDVGSSSASYQEKDLLRRAADKDETAFLALYELHRASMFRFAYRLLASIEAAEDAVHDSFLEVIKHPANFDETRGNLRAYLLGIVRFQAFKRLRRQGIEIKFEDENEFARLEAQAINGFAAARRNNNNGGNSSSVASTITTAAPNADPLKIAIDNETARAVRKAIEALPPLQKEAVILFEYEQLSLIEIAQVTNTEVGAVKARLHRARQSLRRELADKLSR